MPESTTFTLVSQTGTGRVAGVASRGIEWAQRGWTVTKHIWKWLRETVTPVGWLCVAALVAWIPVGIFLRWPEFAVAGIIAAVLLLGAVPFLFGGRSYAVDFSLPDDRVVAGTEVTATVSITNTSPHVELPGRLEIPIGTGLTEIGIPLLRPGQSFVTDVAIPAHRRGVIPVGPLTTVRTDFVGVLRRELLWSDVRELFVHPQTVSVPSTATGLIRDLEGNPTLNLTDSDISFHAIRQYHPGDGQRHIHWKSTAKTGTLMVRQFEESRRSRMVLILGTRETEFAEDEEFEMAVSILGSLGARAIRDGRNLAVVASVELSALSSRSVRGIRDLSVRSGRKLLDALSLVERHEYSMPLEEICQLTAKAKHDMSLAVIICGSTVTARDLQRMRLQLPTDMSVLAVMCDPNAAPSFRSLVGLRVLTVAILDDIRGLMARYK